MVYTMVINLKIQKMHVCMRMMSARWWDKNSQSLFSSHRHNSTTIKGHISCGGIQRSPWVSMKLAALKPVGEFLEPSYHNPSTWHSTLWLKGNTQSLSFSLGKEGENWSICPCVNVLNFKEASQKTSFCLASVWTLTGKGPVWELLKTKAKVWISVHSLAIVLPSSWHRTRWWKPPNPSLSLGRERVGASIQCLGFLEGCPWN